MKNTENTTSLQISKQQSAAELIRVGKEGIEPGDETVLNDYFADNYIFHGPDGDMTFEQLKDFWKIWRKALTNFQITREQIVVEGNMIGARNTFSGIFDNELSQSAVGPLKPTGKLVKIEVINTFRFNDEGKLAEEWVQYDNLATLKQFGFDLLANR